MQSTSINEQSLSQPLFVQRKAIFHELTLVCSPHWGFGGQHNIELTFPFCEKTKRAQGYTQYNLLMNDQAHYFLPRRLHERYSHRQPQLQPDDKEDHENHLKRMTGKGSGMCVTTINEMFSTPINWIANISEYILLLQGMLWWRWNKQASWLIVKWVWLGQIQLTGLVLELDVHYSFITPGRFKSKNI